MFYDAPVARFVRCGDALQLETDTFSAGPVERMRPARIVIRGIDGIDRNDEWIGAFPIEGEDAEIYGLDVSAGGAELTLIWHRWEPKAPEIFAVYRFPGASAHAEDLGVGPPLVVPDP